MDLQQLIKELTNKNVECCNKYRGNCIDMIEGKCSCYNALAVDYFEELQRDKAKKKR